MRFDDHRIAGREVGEHRRISVPGGEGGAGEHHRHAPRHEPIALVQAQCGRAEPPLPERLARDRRHRLIRVHQGLDAAVERIGAAARIAHQGALPCGMHHGLSRLEHRVVESIHDLHADADALGRIRSRPTRHGTRCRLVKRIGIGTRVVDAERLLRIGRHLACQPPESARLREFEGTTERRRERGLACRSRRLAAPMTIGRLREQRMIPPVAAGERCRGERLTMFGVEVFGHRGLLLGSARGRRHSSSWRRRPRTVVSSADSTNRRPDNRA